MIWKQEFLTLKLASNDRLMNHIMREEFSSSIVTSTLMSLTSWMSAEIYLSMKPDFPMDITFSLKMNKTIIIKNSTMYSTRKTEQLMETHQWELLMQFHHPQQITVAPIVETHRCRLLTQFHHHQQISSWKTLCKNTSKVGHELEDGIKFLLRALISSWYMLNN